MRVVIVDDEPVARRGLRHLLRAYDDVIVVGEAHSGREAVRMLTALSPDLVLLDIQMPGGDAFDVLRQTRRPLPAVIFVTAYDAYAVRAFETHALDYIVKPVREDRFGAAIERARDRMRSAAAVQEAERLARVLAELEPRSTDPPAHRVQRLLIPGANGDLLIELSDVRWIQADDYYAAVHAHGRRHLLRESLDSLEARLEPGRFVRVHRSALVNLAHVRELRRAGARPALVLTDGTVVPLSRRRRAAVAEALRRIASDALP